MKRTHLVLLIVLLSGFTLTAAQAQTNRRRADKAPKPATTSAPAEPVQSFRVSLLARSYGDSIVLRWAPSNALLFRATTRGGGYWLTRRSVGPDKKIKTDFRVKISPWTIDEWKQKVGPRDTLAGVCVQLLYGKSSVLKPGEGVTLDRMVEQNTQDGMRLMIALTLADADARHAEGMGLRFTDRQVERGLTYFYTLLPIANPVEYPTPAEKATVVNLGPGPRPAMVTVGGEGANRLVTLRWDRTSTEEQFSAYYIDRSADGGRTWRRLNRRPWMQSSMARFAKQVEYRDSVARNYQPYQYRVVGITPFAELSVPSAPITLMALDRVPPSAVMNLKTKHLDGTRVQLSWQYGKPPGDLAGFAVGRGRQVGGPFTPVSDQLVPPTARTFTDLTADPYEQTYYVVVAIDTARNANSTPPVLCQFRDLKGPSKPKNLKGYIDTTGFVRVVWDPNPERDIMGYTIAYANDPTHVFTPATADYLPIPMFDDRTTLKTLTRKLYYRVVAFDQHRNPSPPSDILMLERPDKVAPAAPAINAFTVSDTSVNLSWLVSASTDVKEQVLYRRNEPTERWRELAKLTAQPNRYADLDVKPNMAYQYMLIAVDSAGLRSSESFPLAVRTPSALPRPARQLAASWAADKKAVVLNWKLPDAYARYIIYRSSPGEPLRTYGAVNRELSFTDKAVPKGTYEYAVKVIYQDGRESGLSNRVSIEVK